MFVNKKKLHGHVHSCLGDVQSRQLGRNHMTVFAPRLAFSISLIFIFHFTADSFPIM